jgi:NAD(P)-dependent dehydrogenase (short-subunit alcohol dehydrogenase family)
MLEAPAPAGRTVLITGAGSGIGRATAGLLLDDGWSVALLDRDEAALVGARATIGETESVRYIASDVTDEVAVERAIEETADAFGGLFGVVNSAGIGLSKGVFETSQADFRRVLDVNVIGTFTVARAAARVMRDQGTHGSIVNIASISGIRGSFNRSAYGASKGAVINLTMVMANELAPIGIRVNAVAPGPVETEMVRTLHTDEDREAFGRFVPMRRYAEPMEIAYAVRFLLDPVQSSYVTGEVLAVDGGYRGAGLISGQT